MTNDEGMTKSEFVASIRAIRGPLSLILAHALAR